MALTLVRLIATGCGTGLSPFAPGTLASLAAVIAGAGLLQVAPWLVLLAGFAATGAGFWALHRVRVDGDPGWVVIDEFAGQWIAMAGLSHPSLVGLVASFGLFRLLDIWKPGPVGWADRQEGVFGIMTDDVLAGVAVALVLAAVRFAWPGLGL